MAELVTKSTWIKGWDRHRLSSATVIPKAESPVQRSRVFDRLREILGYDLREQQLLAEGSRELAEESLALSEGTLAAGFEALQREDLPPEE
jgi:hypothetical protein